MGRVNICPDAASCRRPQRLCIPVGSCNGHAFLVDAVCTACITSLFDDKLLHGDFLLLLEHECIDLLHQA